MSKNSGQQEADDLKRAIIEFLKSVAEMNKWQQGPSFGVYENEREGREGLVGISTLRNTESNDPHLSLVNVGLKLHKRSKRYVVTVFQVLNGSRVLSEVGWLTIDLHDKLIASYREVEDDRDMSQFWIVESIENLRVLFNEYDWCMKFLKEDTVFNLPQL